jgi:ribonucleoside-diphosphate reductase alpha chain
VDRSATLDWDALRNKIAQDGMRNSNCVAIAPTATISNIIGVDACIEPCFGNLSVKSNLSGEFTVINSYLVRDLKRLGLWDEVMVVDLKHFRRLAAPHRPRAARSQSAVRHRLRGRATVDRGSCRAPPKVDRSSPVLNIYMAGASGKKLDDTYKLAWLRGLKTTYYLRTMSATHVEKSTVQSGPAQRRLLGRSPGNSDGCVLPAPSALGRLQRHLRASADESDCGDRHQVLCAIDDPGCEACQCTPSTHLSFLRASTAQLLCEARTSQCALRCN